MTTGSGPTLQQDGDAMKWLEASLLNLLQESVFVLSADRRVARTNDAASRVFGYSKEDLVGSSTEGLHVDRAHFEAFDQRIAEAAARGEPAQFDFQLRRCSGEIFLTEHNVSPLIDPEGRVLCIVDVVRDITRQGEVEEALRKNEARFGALTEFSPAGIYMTDLQGRCVFANPAWCRMAGLSAEDALGDRWQEGLHKEDRERIFRTWGEFLRDETQVWSCDYRFVDAEGRETWVHGTASRMLDTDGATMGYVGINSDITQRKRYEEDLAQQRRFLEKAQTIGVIGTWELDLRKNELQWTDENYRIFGLPIGTPLTYETFMGCVHPDDRAYVDRMWKAGLAGEPYDIEHRLIADGRIKWVRERAELTYDQQGQPLRGTGVTQDITDWKQTLEFLDTVGEIAKVGGWWLDLKDRTVHWTRETARIHEVPADYVPDLETAIEFYEADERDSVRAAVQQALDQGKPYDRLWGFVTAKGRRRLIRAIGQPEVEDGKTIGLRGTFQDVTEQKAAEERLLRNQKLESLGVLAGGIAHDFNNLMTGVLGNVSLARSQLPERSPARECLDETERNLLQARGLASQLLMFSRREKPSRKLHDAAPLLRDAATFANRGSTSSLVLDFRAGTTTVEMNGDMISQVISNLIINANQSMPTGGTLRLETENRTIDHQEHYGLAGGEYLEIRVSDTGCGISPEHIKNIFDPYFSTKGTGRGLGLATCQSVLADHGGALNVESALGVGTTFTVLLPISHGDLEERDRGALPAGPQGLKVLVVDDEPAVRWVLSRMLEKQGCLVEAVGDGETALDAYRAAGVTERPFDLCILDLTLPGGMGGVEIARGIRDIDANAYLIVSSGYSEDEAMSSPTAHGFDGVLPKPYSLNELKATLAAWVRGR